MIHLLAISRPAVIACVAVLTPACGASRAATPQVDRSGTSQIITAQQIEESGAATAWDVVRRVAPQLMAVESNGRPISLRRRGRASMQLSDAPLVFLDGVRLTNWRDLDLVPAVTIHTIEILNGIDGSARYGTNAVGGVIVVRTKA